MLEAKYFVHCEAWENLKQRGNSINSSKNSILVTQRIQRSKPL